MPQQRRNLTPKDDTMRATLQPIETATGALRWLVRIEGCGAPFTLETAFDSSSAAERAARRIAEECRAPTFDVVTLPLAR